MQRGPHFFDDQDMVVIGEPDECLEKLVRYEVIGCHSVIRSMRVDKLSTTNCGVHRALARGTASLR
jgi:hypothetical protein